MVFLPPAPEAAPPAHSILVIDDERDVGEALRGLLETSLSHQAHIRVAKSAEEGSKALREEHYDLVLCDFKLPGRNGVEFLRETRERSPATRRVLMTAYADLTVAVEAINEAAVDNFIQKPFEPEEVLAKVEGLLEEKRARELREQAFARALEALRKRVEQGA
ncbi:MAG TPA: response regulator [Candidatus Thermoplasmatota archaeon]|nr:response regulator [Candidatus Thermoplasmatota archaeon]